MAGEIDHSAPSTDVTTSQASATEAIDTSTGGNHVFGSVNSDTVYSWQNSKADINTVPAHNEGIASSSKHAPILNSDASTFESMAQRYLGRFPNSSVADDMFVSSRGTPSEDFMRKTGAEPQYSSTGVHSEIRRDESLRPYTEGQYPARSQFSTVSQQSDLPLMLSGLDAIRAQLDSFVEDVPSWKQSSRASNVDKGSHEQDGFSAPNGTNDREDSGSYEQHKQHGISEGSMGSTERNAFERERQSWELRQQEQLAVVRACLSEREDLKRQVAVGKDAIEQFRREMMVAVDRLSSQRQKWLRDVDVRDAEIEKLQNMLADNETSLGEHEREVAVLKQTAQCTAAEKRAAEDEAARVREELARVAVQLSDTKAELARAQNNTNAETERLQLELRTLRTQHQNELSDRDTEIAELKAAGRDADAKLRKMDMDLSSCRHDCDNLRSEAALTQAKHDAAVASAVAQAKAQSEREALSRERDAKDAAATEMAQARERHREQLDAQLARHRDELAEMRQQRDADTTRHRRELETEREAHEHALGEVQWKLHEAQARLLAVQQRTEAREAALGNAEQVVSLGTELQSTLRQQFDTVTRAAHALTEASKTLTEETSSIVNDVASEVHDATDTLNHAPTHMSTRSYPNRTGRQTLTSSLSATNVQGLPVSPGRGLRMMVQAGTSSATTPARYPDVSHGGASDSHASGSTGAFSGSAFHTSPTSTDRAAKGVGTVTGQRGADNGSEGSDKRTATGTTDNSVLARALHYRYTGGSPATTGALTHTSSVHYSSPLVASTSALNRIPGALSGTVDTFRSTPAYITPRSPARTDRHESANGKGGGTGELAWSTQAPPHAGSTSAGRGSGLTTSNAYTTPSTSASTTVTPARDYDKPWLAGIRTSTHRSRPSTIATTRLDVSVADVYQMLRREKEHSSSTHEHTVARHQPAAGANLMPSQATATGAPHSGPTRAEHDKRGSKKRVWR
eukprot:m.740297 g.740297  ORF g.740297 m.740297 type:complete len:972 (-) comp23113_c0_seq1:251-3166(-)